MTPGRASSAVSGRVIVRSLRSVLWRVILATRDLEGPGGLPPRGASSRLDPAGPGKRATRHPGPHPRAPARGAAKGAFVSSPDKPPVPLFVSLAKVYR